MAYKAGICWCCGNKRPVEAHHVIPRNYGGKDEGKTVDICAACHSILHSEAEVFFKIGRYQEIDSTIPENTQYGKNIRALIQAVVLSKQRFEAGLAEVSEQRRMTQISWDSQEELLMAHDVKRMLKFKSLERAIKHIVREKYIELQQK